MPVLEDIGLDDEVFADRALDGVAPAIDQRSHIFDHDRRRMERHRQGVAHSRQGAGEKGSVEGGGVAVFSEPEFSEPVSRFKRDHTEKQFL